MDVMPAIPSGNNYSGVEASGVFVCGMRIRKVSGAQKCLLLVCCYLFICLLRWLFEESSGGCEQRVDDTLFLFYDEECGAAHDTQPAWIISPLAPQVALERNLHGKNNGGCWNWAAASKLL